MKEHSNEHVVKVVGIDLAKRSFHVYGADHLAWARKEGDWQKLDRTQGLAIALDERRGLRFQLRALAMQGLNLATAALNHGPAYCGRAKPATGGAASGAGVDMYDGQWRYSLTPYAWFPNIPQTLEFSTPSGGGKSVEVEVKSDSYLSDLEFALMGAFEARQGDWALAMDLVYSIRRRPVRKPSY